MIARASKALLIAWVVSGCANGLMAQLRNATAFAYRNRLGFNDAQQLPELSQVGFTALSCISDTTGDLKAVVGIDSISLSWRIYDADLLSVPGVPAGFRIDQGGFPRAVFIPKPGAPDSLYLFYTDRYTTSAPHMRRLGLIRFDAGAPGQPAGGFHPAIDWLSTDIASCFMAVPHANEQDYWVVVQPIGSNAFHAHRISADGVDPVPVVSSGGPVRGIDWQHGQWVPNTQGDRFVYAQRKSTGAGGSIPDTLAAELFAFDIDQGTVSHLVTLPSKRVIGTEFSASGRYLYVLEQLPFWTTQGCVVTLVQYDLEAADVAGSRTVVHTYTSADVVSLYVRVQMLRGIDGRIYCASEDDDDPLGVIMEPDQMAPLCNYIHEAIPIPSPAAGFFTPLKRYHDSPAIITAVAERALTEMRVAPQPLTESGWLSHPSLEGALRIRWLDAAGRIAREDPVQASGGRARIDAGGLAPGLYAVEVSGGQLAAPVSSRVVVGH